MSARIFLAGDVQVVVDDRVLGRERFVGLQTRVVFAMLAAEHERPFSLEEIVMELWGDSPPSAPEKGIRAVVSRIRAALAEVGLGGAIAGSSGAYRLTLPDDAWVDLVAAAEAIHRAEPALRDGNVDDAVGFGRVAATIADRPLLLGADGPWVTRRRAQLRDIRLRALDCLSEAWLRHGDPAQAARDAEIASSIDPFRERSHRLLMRALADGGDRAGALRAYERLRSLLADELGADPSGETEAFYLEILRS